MIDQIFECSIFDSTVKLNTKGSHMKTCSKQEGKRFSCPECPYVVDHQGWIKKVQFTHDFIFIILTTLCGQGRLRGTRMQNSQRRPVPLLR